MFDVVDKRVCSKLNPKQLVFCKQYVLLNDGAKAAAAAGYSAKSRAVQAVKLLEMPAVKREIGKLRAKQNKEYKEQLDNAMEQLFYCLTRQGTDLVDSETDEILPLHEMPQRVNAAIDGYEQEVTYNKLGDRTVKKKIKLVSKATAIEMALKIQGAYAPEKHEMKTAVVDLTQLYGMPPNVLEPDVIELELA